MWLELLAMECRGTGLNFEIIEILKGNIFLVEMRFPIMGKRREYFLELGLGRKIGLEQWIVQGDLAKTSVFPSRSIRTL